MKNPIIYLIVFLLMSGSINAQEQTRWIEIGAGTYEYGFIYPYKIKLSVPFGVRNIEEIKEGLQPMKFTLDWLPINYSKEQVDELFFNQLEEGYDDKGSFRLAENVIKYFLKKLPSAEKHDTWTFIYYPDMGSKLFIDGKKIHHLVGAEFNRALVNSWVDKSPVLTSNLFNRLLKIQK